MFLRFLALFVPKSVDSILAAFHVAINDLNDLAGMLGARAEEHATDVIEAQAAYANAVNEQARALAVAERLRQIVE